MLTPEDKIILSSVKIKPSVAELEYLDRLIPQVTDWNYLLFNSVERGIAPLIFRKLAQLSNRNIIPGNIQQKFELAYFTTLRRSVVMYETFRKVTEVFQANNIRFIPLKGIYLSEWLYNDIGLRQFSDIDLLVNEADGPRSLEVLQTIGFRFATHKFTVNEFVDSKSQAHFNPLVRDDVMVEIHVKLQNTREKYQQNLSEIWQQTETITLNKSQVEVLELTDLLIHLCLHLDKHFITSHIQFTCFNDITNLLCLHADKIDWEKFEAKCVEYKFHDTVFKYLVMVNRYFNAPLSDLLVSKYNYLLTDKDEERFYNYLKSEENEFLRERLKVPTAVGVHWIHLKNLKSLPEFVRYATGIVFPKPSFMIAKYKIKHKALIPFYYPYRYYTAIRGFIYLSARALKRKA